MRKALLVLIVVFCVVATGAFGQNFLISSKVSSAPALDGMAMDSVWASATPLMVTLDSTPYQPNNGYDGMRKTEVSLKSVYTDDTVYFLAEWADPTKSLERFPWVKQSDGTWKQSVNKDSTGHENTYYEDKFAMYWDISTPAFANAGCAISCHLNVDKSAGRKYTPGPGQTIDMWHWKSVRTGPVSQFDDQMVDDNTDPSVNGSWGRRGDTKTGGGYVNNVKDGDILWQDAKTGSVVNDQYWINTNAKVPFVDTYKTGDKIAGIVISPFEGPRADISAEAKWANGKWTLEYSRSLVTRSENASVEDVQFTDLSKQYAFGVAVFDNSQINHLFHWGVLKLIFRK